MKYKVQDEKGNIFETKDTIEKFKVGDEVYIDGKKNIYHGKLKGGTAYGNPTKVLPVTIEIKDSGDVEIIEESDFFVSFKFNGKLLNGLWVMRCENPESDIWILSKGHLSENKIDDSSTLTLSTDSMFFDFTESQFPKEIVYKNNSYNLIRTKDEGLLLNKKKR